MTEKKCSSISSINIELEEVNEDHLKKHCDASKVPKAIYGVDDVPPLGTTILNGIQHFLVSVVGAIVIPTMLFPVLCFDDSPDSNYYKSEIIGSFFVMAGLVSFLQTTIGIRLPTAQIVTLSHFIPLLTLFTNSKWECPSKVNNVTIWNQTSNSSSHNVIGYTPTSNVYLDYDGQLVGSTELWQRRVREVQGAVIVSGSIQMVIGGTGAIGYALRLIGPLTIAPPLIIASISLLGVSRRLASVHWGISLAVTAIVIFFQYLWRFKVPLPYVSPKKRQYKVTRKPIFAMFPFIFAIMLGWLLAYFLTIGNALPTDPNAKAYAARTDRMPDHFSNGPWVSFPYPFRWGLPTFSAPTIIGMMAALIVGVTDSLCDFYAIAKLVDHPAIPEHAMNRGILIEGFGIALHGIVGTGNATTTFADNIVALGVTQVYSRRVIQAMGIIFVVVGLLTKVCGIFLLVPSPVFGGQVLIVSGMIFAIAISTAASADLSSIRNMFVLGISTFTALSLETWMKENPGAVDVGSTEGNEVVRAIVGTGMLLAPILACFLDNTMPGTPESRGMIKWQGGETKMSQDTEGNDPIYNLPFKTNWKWTKWLPICPLYARDSRKSSDSESDRV